MKTAFLSLAALVLISACHKENDIVLIPEHTYGLRSDVFNKGSYQPQTPVKLIDLYIGASGIPYSHCTARVNWSAFALRAGNGVADQTVRANQLLVNGGVTPGDTTTLTWPIPQYDLR